jgi:hypothetical protein
MDLHSGVCFALFAAVVRYRTRTIHVVILLFKRSNTDQADKRT